MHKVELAWYCFIYSSDFSVHAEVKGEAVRWSYVAIGKFGESVCPLAVVV